MTPLELYRRCIDGPWNLVDGATDTECSITEVDGVHVIVFEGSISFIDWLYNLFFWTVPYKDMKSKFRYHAGFVRKYHSIRDALHVILENDGVAKVVVAGYSQGAGVSILCAEDIAYNFPKIEMLDAAVFGCARPTNKRGKRIIDARVPMLRNYRCGNDAVTKLPPWGKALGTIVDIGPKRKPLRYSREDHVSYGDYLPG